MHLHMTFPKLLLKRRFTSILAEPTGHKQFQGLA